MADFSYHHDSNFMHDLPFKFPHSFADHQQLAAINGVSSSFPRETNISMRSKSNYPVINLQDPLTKKRKTNERAHKDVNLISNSFKSSKVSSSSSSRERITMLMETEKRRKSKKAASSKRVSEEGERSEASQRYIHVRARRGQATDSHSLAERVRREKISEKMKLLQGLVPGCDKVSGKALLLDEIINYVQFLQNQVEFLSMKLASVSPIWYNFHLAFSDSEDNQKIEDLLLPHPPLMFDVQQVSETILLQQGQSSITTFSQGFMI